MKRFILFATLISSLGSRAQYFAEASKEQPIPVNLTSAILQDSAAANTNSKKIKLKDDGRWRINKNKIWTGGLVMLSGMAKGFNETLEFNWHGFEAVFPKANPKWFWPQQSFKNKYRDGDPAKGPKFPLSTSVLVFTTDQYHLNNFIHRASLTAALVIKIGEGKKPFKYYLFDALYYTAAYQLGFGSVYYYFKSRVP